MERKRKKVFASEGTFEAKIRAHPPILLLKRSFANSFGGMNRVDLLNLGSPVSTEKKGVTQILRCQDILMHPAYFRQRLLFAQE